MTPTEVDVRVLDLLADDYYGLWEVCDYFVQLMPETPPDDSRKICRDRVKTYLQEGLIDVFLGTMTKDDFRELPDNLRMDALDDEHSWATPKGIGEVVAIRANKNAEELLAKHPIQW